MQANVRVRIQNDAQLHIHNDLSQAATYFNDVIRQKLKDDKRDGIAFDGMACALMIAFAFEAYLNFMGSYLLKSGKINDWNEGAKFSKKRSKVFKALSIDLDENERPLSSMERMKVLRDTFAHGKPVEIKNDEEKEGKQGEFDRGTNLAAAWEDEIKPDVVGEALSDLDKLWKHMIEKSGVSVWDTLTRGERTVSLIERA